MRDGVEQGWTLWPTTRAESCTLWPTSSRTIRYSPAHEGAEQCPPLRPTEVESLLGDAGKIRAKLGWTPEISFDALVREMVDSDLALAKRDALVAKEGYKVYRQHE